MDDMLHTESQRREAFDRFKAQAVQVLCMEKRVAPRRIVEEAVELFWPIIRISGIIPSVDQVETLLSGMRGVFFLRWGVAKQSTSVRKDILYGGRSKVERYLEARSTNLLGKKQELSVKQLIREAEYYYKIPDMVAIPLVKKVIRRVRMRDRRFRSEQNWHKVLRRYDLPVLAFMELSHHGIITPRTDNETFRVLGKALQHFLRSGKLKLF